MSYKPLLVIDKIESKLKPIHKKEDIDCSKKLFYTINGGLYKGFLKEYLNPKDLINYLDQHNKVLNNHGWYQIIDESK